MIGSLLLLGFTLSLDNFRTAVVLGAIPLQNGERVRGGVSLPPASLEGILR